MLPDSACKGVPTMILAFIVFISILLCYLNYARFAQGVHVIIKIPLALILFGISLGVWFLVMGLVIGTWGELAGVDVEQSHNIPFSIDLIGTASGYLSLVPVVLLSRALLKRLNRERTSSLPPNDSPKGTKSKWPLFGAIIFLLVIGGVGWWAAQSLELLEMEEQLSAPYQEPKAAQIPTPIPPTLRPPAPGNIRLLPAPAHPPTLSFPPPTAGYMDTPTIPPFLQTLPTGITPVPTPALAPTMTPRPTATPKPTATPRPTPTPTPSPQEQLESLKRLLLDLTNRERQKAGVQPVRLGSNRAAQLHAEAALEGCYSGHWDRWGLKPNYRYTLAGGTGADGENVAGLSYCIKLGDGYSSIDNILEEIADNVQGWMDSPGHRKTLLDPAYTILNVGIAFDNYNSVMVQQFGSDYLSYTIKPTLSSEGILRFKGAVNGATLDIGDIVNFSIYWHPPLRHLTTGQISHTYSLCGDRKIGFLREPLPPDWYYEDSTRTGTVPVRCIDPYDNGLSLPAPGSYDQAHVVWSKTKRMSGTSTMVRREVYEYITATLWRVERHSFDVAADISSLTEGYGPGVYTLIIWGQPDHMGGPTPISQYAMFWKTRPPEGHPYTLAK